MEKKTINGSTERDRGKGKLIKNLHIRDWGKKKKETEMHGGEKGGSRNLHRRERLWSS